MLLGIPTVCGARGLHLWSPFCMPRICWGDQGGAVVVRRSCCRCPKRVMRTLSLCFSMRVVARSKWNFLPMMHSPSWLYRPCRCLRWRIRLADAYQMMMASLFSELPPGGGIPPLRKEPFGAETRREEAYPQESARGNSLPPS